MNLMKDKVLNFEMLNELRSNLFVDKKFAAVSDQHQTMNSFSFKWKKLDSASQSYSNLETFQKDWFLKLYGFSSEEDLKNKLSNVRVILDAGCGKGYKAAWMAKLAPHALVVGVDISEALEEASEIYKEVPNLLFIRGDISHLNFINRGSIDFTYCDQVIMHTTVPEETFKTLAAVTSKSGSVLTYVYRKKALPRELVDTHFRSLTHNIPDEEMMTFSRQLTELGKFLEEKFPENVTFPGVDLLGIKRGNMSVQRFIYWNFLKCFWNKDFGFDLSTLTNFDWYSPSQASRYSKEEFMGWIQNNNLSVEYFHEEEACYSGRFKN